MANHPSALKRNRQSQKRKLRNNARKNEIKSLVKKILSATKSEAQDLLSKVQSKLGKAARKNVLHRRTAARKLSRLTKAVAAKS